MSVTNERRGQETRSWEGPGLTSNTLYKLTQYRAPTHEPLHQNILSSGVLINNVEHLSSVCLLAAKSNQVHFGMKSRFQAKLLISAISALIRVFQVRKKVRREEREDGD